MKKIAVLLSFVLSALSVVPAGAQNLQSRYDANGIGTVSYSLNSGGSFYGQVNNSGTASNWSLGFGSSQSTVGTGVITWNSNGHILLGGTGVPVVSSCGTAPSVAVGSDNAGDVTMGSAAATTCTLTFASTFATAPHCFINNRSSKLVGLAQTTTSTLIIVGTGAGAFATVNDIVDWYCVGH